MFLKTKPVENFLQLIKDKDKDKDKDILFQV